MKWILGAVLIAIIVLEAFRSYRKHYGLWPGEQEVMELYSSMYQSSLGFSQSQARTMVRGLIKQGKKDAKKEGTAQQTPNFGDRILSIESKDDSVRGVLGALRAEGVRDEDIRWWWNMHEIERRMMVADDNLHRGAAFIKYQKEGLSPDQAAARLRRAFVMYGEPTDTTNSSGEDRPLPFQLKDRVNIFLRRIGERGDVGQMALKKEMDAASSFNALIRQKILDGSL